MPQNGIFFNFNFEIILADSLSGLILIFYRGNQVNLLRKSRPFFSLDYFPIFSVLVILGVYLLVMLINDGFMATDEYWTGITRYIPAQTSQLSTLVHADDVKSPLQIMPMHAVAQLALNIGATTPYLQYRIVLGVLGLINTLLLIFAFLLYAEWRKCGRRDKNLILLMLCFYFAAPFAFTRPMFEALAAPWLALAAVAALNYDEFGRRKTLLMGVAAASIAFVFRQQVGICALVFIILPLMKKRGKDFFAASALGLTFFVLAGIPDYFMRGQFHFSLIQLTLYNFEHGHEYGSQPITFYPLMILVMTFSPFFIARYGKNFFKGTLKKQRGLWIMILLFVFLHSLFSQKWERFLISIVPILIFILEPYLLWMIDRWSQYRTRIVGLTAFNGILFLLASFFPPQKNLISLSLYLDKHPEVINLYKIEDTPEWITDSFILNGHYHFVNVKPEELTAVDWKNCDNALVIGAPKVEELTNIVSQLELRESFPVNAIEAASYKLNPQNNVRRVELKLYGCRR
jgi:hypothetical protein